MGSGQGRRWSVAVVFIFHAVISGAPIYAQQATTTAGVRLTLAELVGLAVQNTQLLGAQDARLEERRLSAAQARVWSGPSIGFLAGRTKQMEASGSRFEVSLAQPIPLTGIPGVRGGLLDLESESLAVERAATQIAVTLAVVESSYEYALSRRKADFAQQRQTRFELVRDYLAGRVFPTPQRKAESRIVGNRAKLVASEAILSQAGFKASFERLKVYVPLGPGEYPDVEVPWFLGERALAGNDWLATALANNPDLRIQRVAVRGAELEKTLASKEGLPDTALVASYEKGQRDIIGTDYGLGISLAFPSWNRNRSGVKSAERKRIAQERLLAFEEQKLRAELSRLLVEYEAARQLVRQYPQELLPDLEAQVKDAEEGFRKGQLDLLTFLELDSSASETYGRVLDAQRELAAKAAALMSAAGEQDALTRLGSL